jgi:hypothetical protein
MRTDELIHAMAADRERPWPPAALLLAAVLVAALAAGVASFSLLGIRDDLGHALLRGPVAVKQAYPLVLAFAAAGAALRLACPGRPLGRWLPALALAPAVLILLVAGTLLTLPSADWMPAMMGQSSARCLLSIGLMSVPLVAAALWALRGGASTRPMLSGALAGLLGGSAATAVYALSCTEDSPLFFGFWYVLAILGATAAGALLGTRLLRW